MATIQACLGRVEIGATPSVVGELRSYSVDEQTEPQDAGSMGDCGRTYAAGVNESTIQIGGRFDHADAGQLEMVVGTLQDIAIQPQGQGTGNPQIQCAGALITGFAVTAEYGGLVEFTMTAQAGVPDRTNQT